MNTELHYLELLELAECLRNREITSVEVTNAQLERIAHFDPHLASYALVTSEEAIDNAAVADAEIAAGNYRGPLHGVPIGVKDLFYTKGVRTSAGMPIHSDFRPNEDATAVARLRAEGAVILGKFQMTEGAYSDHRVFSARLRSARTRRFLAATKRWCLDSRLRLADGNI